MRSITESTPPPCRPSASQPARRACDWNYEAIQFPVFYIVAAPIYKLLAGDVRLAIHGVRLLNVALSAVFLVLLAVLLRRSFGLAPPKAMAIALPLALIPGVTLRSSQVTNEVLAGLLLTALLITLVKPDPARPRWHTFLEGVLLGLAIMTKLTAIAILPAVALAWLTRRGQLGTRLMAESPAPPSPSDRGWPGRSPSTPARYRSWRGTRVFNVAEFAPPHTVRTWLSFGKQLLYYFWLPWEWRVPSGTWAWVPRLTPLVAGLVVTLLAAASLVLVLRNRIEAVGRPVAIAGITLASFAISYALFATALQQVWPTDLRELIFLGALAILLGPVASRVIPSLGHGGVGPRARHLADSRRRLLPARPLRLLTPG